MSQITVTSDALEQTSAVTGRADTIRRLLHRWPAVIALLALAALIIAVVFAGEIAPYSPDALDVQSTFAAPSLHHLMGTDELGRDLFSRMLFGGRFDLLVATGATLISVVVGFSWGAAAAMLGGWAEDLLMRVADIAMAIPALVLGLILVSAFGPSSESMIIILGLLLCPWPARVSRAAVLAERQRDYCLAAVSFGSSIWTVLTREILPNLLGLIVVQAAITAANVILIEATLSFVGLGPQPPAASWGTLLTSGYNNVQYSIWYGLFPGLVIFLFVLCLNILANHIQAVLDPRSYA